MKNQLLKTCLLCLLLLCAGISACTESSTVTPPQSPYSSYTITGVQLIRMPPPFSDQGSDISFNFVYDSYDDHYKKHTTADYGGMYHDITESDLPLDLNTTEHMVKVPINILGLTFKFYDDKKPYPLPRAMGEVYFSRETLTNNHTYPAEVIQYVSYPYGSILGVQLTIQWNK